MNTPLRLGVLRLVDSAPAVLAEADGLFADEGLDVRLLVEPSWANIADKLAWGALDAAIILTPLALAAAAGLRGPRTDLVVPMGISQGGNAVVVSNDVAAALGGAPMDAPAAGRAFAGWLSRQPAPPRFAVVHVFSTHNLLFRDWLASAGIDPDREVDIVIVPPQRVTRSLAEGEITGFCAGAPWGDYAAALGVGRVVLGSSAIRPGHAEKCLAIATAFARSHADDSAALVRALRRAQAACEVESRAGALAHLLAERLDLPEEASRAALPGGAGIERIAFAASADLAAAEVAWTCAQMQRWGWLPNDDATAALVAAVFRCGG
ncbi:MAG: CmpA/NrtA family ABC transporter substrate-binding protein [Acetobacteraceae bacterium]